MADNDVRADGPADEMGGGDFIHEVPSDGRADNPKTDLEFKHANIIGDLCRFVKADLIR